MGTYARWAAGWDPARTAVTTGSGAMTFAALDAAVGRACGWLHGIGVSPGDVVGIAVPKGVDALLVTLAAIRLGAVALPLNDRYTPRELAHPLMDAGARVAIVPDAVVDQLPAGVHLVRASALPGALATAAPPPAFADPGDDVRQLLLYTSGTTGRPKGVPLTARQVEATVDALHAAWRWSAEDVLLHALPLNHVHGLVVAAFGALRAGATLILWPSFDADAALDALAGGGPPPHPTVFMGVPTFYARLLDLGRSRDLSGMRLVTSGSAGLPAEVHAAIRDRFGVSVIERYGMTEIGIVVSNDLDDPRPGSIGRPLPGVDVRIVDASDRDVAPGEVGELHVRAPSAFAGYHQLPDATAAVITATGHVRTGDLGRWTDDGRILLVGRRSELVIVGGLNVYPAEVEAEIAGLAGVREVAVIGVPDRDLGEVPVAFVAGDTGLDLASIPGQLRARLAPYKIPRRYVRVDALPRNAMGKVVKAALAGLSAGDGVTATQPRGR